MTLNVDGFCPKQWTLDFLGDPSTTADGLVRCGSLEYRARMPDSVDNEHRDSRIIFAPGTNFDAKARKPSNKPTFFNIRAVNNGYRSRKNLSCLPDATKVSDDAFIAMKSRHNSTDAYNLLNFSNEKCGIPSKSSFLWKVPVPMSPSTLTLCSYVGQKKTLLSRGNLVRLTVGSSEPGVSLTSGNNALFPNASFPPVLSRRSLVVENQLEKYLEKKVVCASRYSRNYSSTDSLNLYRTQSLRSLGQSSTNVFLPYRHVPNLKESIQQKTGCLRDNERIHMLGEQFSLDDRDLQRQMAYGVEYNVVPDKDFIIDI